MIKDIRQNLGLTQTELAKAIGISQGAISQIESDSVELTVNVARELIRVSKERGLIISFNDLFK